MQYIGRDRKIHIQWSVFRGTSNVPEDFSRALVKVFLIGNYEKYLLDASAIGGTLTADIPQGLPEGVYSLEAIWVKNYGNLMPRRQTLTPEGTPGCARYPGYRPNDPPMMHPHDHRFNDRCLMRARKEYVFALTDHESEVTEAYEDEITLRLKSAVATYGYDGLSAYEIAVMRGDFNGTEGEWLESLGNGGGIYLAKETGYSDKIGMTQRAITVELDKLNEKYDNLKNKFEEGILSKENFINLLKQCIDNDTIKFDAERKVIYCDCGGGGGGGEETSHLITLDINPADIVKVEKVEATGDVSESTVSEDGGHYAFTVPDGGNVTVKITPAEGYAVNRLNVDKVSQGAIAEYTFSNVTAAHTMYLWMEAAEEPVVEGFLVRSDKPDVEYASTQSVFDALKADYPDGLTQDVTVTCTKKTTEPRTAGWVGTLEDWNQGTMYTLTLDGAGLLTYDGKSLGILAFYDVDNVLVRDVTFTNYCNLVDAYSPGDTFAFMCKASGDRKMNNICLQDCTFNGAYVGESESSDMAYQAILCNDVTNVTVCGCTINKNYGWAAAQFGGCDSINFVKNSLELEYVYGKMGHVYGVVVGDGLQFTFEDNSIIGNGNNEVLVTISTISRASIKRNRFTNADGYALSMSHISQMDEVVLESNLFSDLLDAPVGGWMKSLIEFCRIKDLRILNNTFRMSGNFYEQYACRYGDVDNLEIFNNIFSKVSQQVIHAFQFNNVGSLSSGNNIYQFDIGTDGRSGGALFWITGEDSTVQIPYANSLDTLQSMGYETNSALLSKDVSLLDANFAITASMDTAHPADTIHLAEADTNYKEPSGSSNSVGCFNLHGIAIDEDEEIAGYAGYDTLSAVDFSELAQHSGMAETQLLLKLKSRNRTRVAKWTFAGSMHNYLLLGKQGVITPLPILDEDGEYVEDELYTVNIE